MRVYRATKEVRVYLEGRLDVPFRTFPESMGARLAETPEESEKWTLNLVL